MMLEHITIGADPELFIIDTKKNKVISAIPLIPGSKENPHHAEDMPKGFAIQTDNIAAEFNIPPARTKEEFVNNIEYMKQYIRTFVKNINPNLDILCESSVEVDGRYLRSKQARTFFCDPDYNVYTRVQNFCPAAEESNMRCTGFHIHVGYDNPNIDASTALVAYLDAYLGIPSILIDDDVKRRNLYGKAGSFRLTRYGVEYRVLSSRLMKTEKDLEWVWDRLENTFYNYNKGGSIPPKNYVQECINNADKNLATTLINKYCLM